MVQSTVSPCESGRGASLTVHWVRDASEWNLLEIFQDFLLILQEVDKVGGIQLLFKGGVSKTIVKDLLTKGFELFLKGRGIIDKKNRNVFYFGLFKLKERIRS